MPYRLHVYAYFRPICHLQYKTMKCTENLPNDSLLLDYLVGHSFCVLCLPVIQNRRRETTSYYISNDGVIVNVEGYIFDVGD